MTMDKHVTLVAILHIALGCIVLFIAVVAFTFFTGIGFFSGESDAMFILSTVGTIAFMLFLLLALPGIIAGLGLLRFKPWARILMIILGVLNLFDVPIGTALGIYTLWVLNDPAARKLFGEEGTVMAPQAHPTQ